MDDAGAGGCGVCRNTGDSTVRMGRLAADLVEEAAPMSNCTECKLAKCPRCRGDGPSPAVLMIVGEAPGAEEARTGVPFVGQSGQELDAYLRTAGLRRSDAYVTNVVKCRPPKNATPDADTVERCRPLLEAEIAAVDPTVIAAVGAVAVRALTGLRKKMEECHGMKYAVTVGGKRRIVVPCYHPAFGLRQPARMLDTQRDFLAVAAAVKQGWEVSTLTPGKGREAWATTIHDDQAGDEERPNLPRHTEAQLDQLFRYGLEGAEVVAVDTEVVDGRCWCVSWSSDGHTGHVAMVGTEWGDKAIAALARAVADRKTTTVLHNALFDLRYLREVGVVPRTVVDTMVMAYVLGDQPQGLKALAYRLLGWEMGSYGALVSGAGGARIADYMQKVVDLGLDKPPAQIVWENGEARLKQPQSLSSKAKTQLGKVVKAAEEEDADEDTDDDAAVNPLWKWWKGVPEVERELAEAVLGTLSPPSLADVDRDKALSYSALDAVATLRVWRELDKVVGQRHQHGILRLDMGALPMIDDMQRWGVKVDKAHFNALSAALSKETYRLETEIRKLAGEYVNPNSSVQVGSVLHRMGVLPAAVTSTDEKTLSAYRHPLIDAVLGYRGLVKLKGTYTDPLPLAADTAHRIHTTFKVTRTETGRLSSADPNLQNIPAAGDWGKKIRNGFVAEKGWKLLSIDYSQIELRVAAHVSGDEAMMRAYAEDLDLHTYTASLIYGKPMADIDPKLERYPCKKINFMIFYGAGAMGVRAAMQADGVDWTEEECEKLRLEWFRAYPGVERWLENTKAFVRRNSYVEDMFGRRRWVPGVRSVHTRIREAALREATNMPIQSGAQGILKTAMGRLQGLCVALGVRPLLQIHDELIFEVREEEVRRVADLFQPVMEGAVKLNVPVKTDAEVGDRWGDLKEMEDGQ